MTSRQPILERLQKIATQLMLPMFVGGFVETPAPSIYLVVTPLVDSFELWADGLPGAEVEEVRVSIFANTNYLPIRDGLTGYLFEQGFTITTRRYIGYEPDTGYHHYAIDIADYRPLGA